LGRQLKNLGVEASFAQNGHEAITALETGEYGILITDLHMPGLDGYGVVQTIRAAEKDTGTHFPVIVLTADVQMAQRDAYLRHGFDECLLKPVSLGQFRRLLIRWGLLDGEAVIQSEEESPAIDSEKDSPPIDQKALKEQMGALDEGAVEMLHMFADMTAPLIEKMNAAQAKGDCPALAEIAHSLKGAARSACCPHLGNLAGMVQERAEKNETSADLVAQAQAEFGRVKAYLDQGLLRPETGAAP
ncbi:MAG: response regulator, partial [Alphaproteobacteria bacterium]|nr:response regulator [Alphaproteobacteria bacterium]